MPPPSVPTLPAQDLQAAVHRLASLIPCTSELRAAFDHMADLVPTVAHGGEIGVDGVATLLMWALRGSKA